MQDQPYDNAAGRIAMQACERPSYPNNEEGLNSPRICIASLYLAISQGCDSRGTSKTIIRVRDGLTCRRSQRADRSGPRDFSCVVCSDMWASEMSLLLRIGGYR